MSRQTKPINKQCQSRSQCSREATIGMYRWEPGETDVDLDRPIKVFCGQHKPCLPYGVLLRNVKIRTEQ